MKKQITSYRVGKFPQKTRRVFTTEQGLKSDKITAMSFNGNGVLFVGTDKGLFRLENDSFKAVDLGLKDPYINSIHFNGNKMLVGTDCTLLGFEGKKKLFTKTFSSPVVDVKYTAEGALWILTQSVLYQESPNKEGYSFKIGVPGVGSCLALYKDNRVYIGTENNGIHALVGKRRHWSELNAQSTNLLSNCITCLYVDPADNIWIGTDKGVCVYDDNSYWVDNSNVDMLPSASITGMAVSENGDKYFSTLTGLIHQHNGQLSYYGYKRWLPSPKAIGVCLSPDGTVCVATDKGLSLIETKLMTLEEKAKELRAVTEKFNIRKDGYCLDRELDHKGVVSLDEGYIPNTDNDGLRTGLYVADLAYEYACTKDEEVRKLARRSLLAMVKLTEITGIDGFTARAIRYPDERDYGTGERIEWHFTKDKEGNDLEWLGETSSDEMVGHFYCYANYYDLVADDEEKELLRGVVSKILDHIIENNFHLVDTDSKPTTWANWNPDLLNNDNKWADEKGTNSLQILAFLTVGYYMTGNEKYKEVFNMLASDKHYVMNLMQYRNPDGHLCHIDDNHDFLMISLLMKYTQDPQLKAIYAMGLTHHWYDERVERNAFFNFVYGASTGERFDAENCIDELVDYPMDQIAWPLYNSYRPDLKWDMSPMEQGMEPQLFEPLPAHERMILTSDLNRFTVDSGAQDVAQPVFEKSNVPCADNVIPPTGNDTGMYLRNCNNFTHAYWYARYYGLIEEA